MTPTATRRSLTEAPMGPTNRADRTPEEPDAIDTVAERKGQEYAEEHAPLILLDARRIGLIDAVQGE